MTHEVQAEHELPRLTLLPYDPITTLRFLGRDVRTVTLPAGEQRFTIGADGCDVMIPRALSTAVSAMHASMERVGSGLLVRDLGSRHGTFRSLREPRCDALLVQPGETFWIGDVAVRVTDRYLEALRSHLACHLGILRDQAIDEAVADVASGEPLLLLGPAGTGARRLAAAIHATSPQRENPRLMGMAPLCLLRRARGCTVFIDLELTMRVFAPYLKALMDRASGVRVIFAASGEKVARARLDHHRERLRTIALVPLAQRRADVPHLLQFHWATELGSRRVVDEMGPAAIEALQAYDWPHNLDELYDSSRRILAYHERGGLRPAARSLSVTHQTLRAHLTRIGFPTTTHERPLPLRGGASVHALLMT